MTAAELIEIAAQHMTSGALKSMDQHDKTMLSLGMAQLIANAFGRSRTEIVNALTKRGREIRGY